MKRFYVGHIAGKLNGEVFKSAETPTANSHPQYTRATGPFKTRRAALWATGYGVTFASIAEAERLALAERNKTLRECAEFTRQQVRQAWANNTLD